MVDDDLELCKLVQTYLHKFQFELDYLTHSLAAINALASKTYGAIIVDVMMPDLDGFGLVRQIRQNGYLLPIIMLTARGEVTDKVIGLENGADDYLSKPFEPRELVARLSALVRRNDMSRQTQEPTDLVFEEIRFYPTQHRVEILTNTTNTSDTTNNPTWQTVLLTDAEWRALMILVRARPNVVSRDDLSAQMRGLSFDVADRSLDITISRVRAKLNESAKQPRFIKTVRYSGYAFIGRVAK